jgi:hypothetical protein
MRDNTDDDKKLAPAVQQHPEARTQRSEVSMSSTSVANTDRMRRILEEAVQRFNNELLADEERQLLLDRIKRLRKRLTA